MYLHQTETSLIIGPKFGLTDFPILMQKHQRDFPGVSDLEAQASLLISNNFSFPYLETYIRAVCRWGNFAGVGGRVLKNNTQQQLHDAFTEAYALIAANPPKVADALARLNQIHGLGTPSFASKHLRFLKPDACPVYDAILTDKLPYQFNPAGYAVFSNDCQSIANLLTQKNVINPGRENGVWLAADVEAAMFAYFYEKNL